MLIDDPKGMLDLFVENLIRGNIKFKIQKLPKEISDSIVEDRDKLRNWYDMRKQDPKPKDFDSFVSDLCSSLIHWRAVEVIEGQLNDIVSEQRIQQLEREKSELIEIIADQKNKLNGLYVESPDKKNIRGII